MPSNRESDWKVFRRLHAIALERFCERVLSELARLASDDSKTNHDRYLAVFKLVHERNAELADAFDNPRRSTAVQQLACIQSHELLTEEEISHFSPEIRDSVQSILAKWRK